MSLFINVRLERLERTLHETVSDLRTLERRLEQSTLSARMHATLAAALVLGHARLGDTPPALAFGPGTVDRALIDVIASYDPYHVELQTLYPKYLLPLDAGPEGVTLDRTPDGFFAGLLGNCDARWTRNTLLRVVLRGIELLGEEPVHPLKRADALGEPHAQRDYRPEETRRRRPS